MIDRRLSGSNPKWGGFRPFRKGIILTHFRGASEKGPGRLFRPTVTFADVGATQRRIDFIGTSPAFRRRDCYNSVCDEACRVPAFKIGH